MTMELLGGGQTGVFERWVLIGLWGGVFAFALSGWAEALEHGSSVLFESTAPWALIVCLLALLAWRRGRVRTAGALVLVTGWLDVHRIFIRLPIEDWAAAAPAVPVIVMLGALLLGRRIGLRAGLLTTVTVPGGIIASGMFGWGPGLAQRGSIIFIVGITTVLLLTLVLVNAFLSSFAAVLESSQSARVRAQELLDDAPDAIVALGPDQVIEEANPAAGQVVGCPASDLIGLPLSELSLVPTDGRVGAAVEKLLAGRSAVEFRDRRGQRYFEGLARRRTRPDRSVGTLIVFRDVTDRREAEQRELALQAQLEHAQRMEAVGLLAGSVAHDFNNLLTAVGGYGALLEISDDVTVREYSGEIVAIQERGAALVRQLLTFARRDTAQPRAIDLAATITTLVPLMERLLGERVRLELSASACCPVIADPHQIEQVMLNLVANARDAMPEGGRLSIECSCGPERVSVSVTDSGAGIPSDVQSRLFEPFFSTKAPGKGTGLGLSTVARIVADAGGAVSVRSVLGAGARFELLFPVTDQVIGTPSDHPIGRVHKSGAGRRIFVAEDNDAVRNYLRRLLERHGYAVTLARSGDEATAVLADIERPPHLLLSDVVMPGRTGLQVAADARVRFPDLPVLLMSGYVGQAAPHGGLEGSADYIQKPFTDSDLLDRIGLKLAAADPGLLSM